MMAGCTNGMAEMAKPIIMVINRTATLGKDLVMAACGVDKGNKTESNELWLQQTNLFCEKANQHSRIANKNIPNAYRLPLEGEWEVCASGEVRDPRSSTNAPNAMPECVHHLSKSSETKDAEGVESEGCKGSTDKPTELLTMSVELYVKDGGDIPCMCLGGTQMRPGDTNGPGCQVDRSRGPTDVLRSWTDTLNMSNSAGTAGLGHSDDLGMYLSITDAKRVVLEMDYDECHVDASTRQTDVLSVKMDSRIPANTLANIRIPRKKKKSPNSPMEAARPCSDKPDGCRDHAEGSSAHTRGHSIGNEREMAANEMDSIRIH